VSYIPINKGQFTLESPDRAARFERKRGHGCEQDYRANRRQWQQYPEQRYVSDYPLHVDLELASVCNLRCPMCFTITDAFKKQVNAKLMDFDLYTKLVDECAAGGVYSLRLSYRGEAFLHPKVVDACRYAKQRGIKEVSSLTNGVRLDEAMFVAMMEAGLDWLTISIDGLGETYEQIRRPAKFDRAVEKITAYARIKREAGRLKPVVKIQSILPAIEDDPQAFYNVFAPISDMVSANPLIDFMADIKASPKVSDFSCPQIYQRLTIGADGLAMMCANDEKGEHIVGDANKQTIHEIWHGEAMRQVRDIHSRHQGCAEIHPCNSCYLPMATEASVIEVDGRSVVSDKYVAGPQKLVQLKSPPRKQRKRRARAPQQP